MDRRQRLGELMERRGVDALRDVLGDTPAGSDLGLADTVDLSDEIARLRRRLDRDAVESTRRPRRSRLLAAAGGLRRPCCSPPQMSALLCIATRCPRARRSRGRAMLVASAERGGLYANLTRIIELEEPDPELAPPARRDEILARLREEATRPGHTLAEAVADCQRFYADAAFPDEWRLHHQGALTGYGSRELIATLSTDHVIEPGQAFAWNPSVTGAKAEETFVLTEARPEVPAGPALAAVPSPG